MNEKEMDRKLPMVKHAAYLHTMRNLSKLMRELTEQHRMLMHLGPTKTAFILTALDALDITFEEINDERS